MFTSFYFLFGKMGFIEWIVLLVSLITSTRGYLFNIPEDGQVKAVTDHNFLHEYKRQLQGECKDDYKKCPEWVAENGPTNHLKKICRLSTKVCTPVSSMPPVYSLWTVNNNRQLLSFGTCQMQFVAQGPNIKIMAPGRRCESPPTINTVLSRFYGAGFITDGDDIEFVSMTYYTGNQPYFNIRGKFLRGNLFWQVDAVGMNFMLESRNTMANDYYSRMVIYGSTYINGAKVDVECIKPGFSHSYAINKFDSNAINVDMMRFLKQIETSIGASSFMANSRYNYPSYMKEEAFRGAIWNSFKGFGTYNMFQHQFSLVLQSTNQKFLTTNEQAEMYFIVDGEMQYSNRNAFVAKFISGNIYNTLRRTTTLPSWLEKDFRENQYSDSWCMIVSSDFFHVPYLNRMSNINNICKIRGFAEGTRFTTTQLYPTYPSNPQPQPTQSLTSTNVNSLNNNKETEVIGRLEENGLQLELPEYKTLDIKGLQSLLKGDGNEIVFPPWFISGVKLVHNIQYKKTKKMFTLQAGVDIDFGECLEALPIDVASVQFKYKRVGKNVPTIELTLAIKFNGNDMTATVKHMKDKWVFSLHFISTSLTAVIKESKLEDSSTKFSYGEWLLSRALTELTLSLQVGTKETIFRFRGTLPTTYFGDITAECLYIHGNGIAVGFVANGISFGDIIASIFGYDISVPWLNNLSIKLAGSYLKKKVLQKKGFEADDLKDIKLVKGFAIQFNLDWQIPTVISGTECEDNSVCIFLQKYLPKDTSIKFSARYESVANKLSINAEISTSIIIYGTLEKPNLQLTSVKAGLDLQFANAKQKLEFKIKISCTIVYTKEDGGKLKFTGSFEASSGGKVKLSFTMDGIIREPLGIPSFGIMNIGLSMDYNFVTPMGVTLALTGTLIFGDVDKVKENSSECPDSVICFTMTLGLNPQIPVKSYIEIETKSPLTIGNIGDKLGFEVPDVIKEYGYPKGFKFSYATEEVDIPGSKKRKIQQGLYYKGEFKFFFLAGVAEINLNIKKKEFKVDIRLEPISWFGGQIQITSYDENKAKKAKGKKGKKNRAAKKKRASKVKGARCMIQVKGDDIQGNISGKLKVFGIELAGFQLEFNKTTILLKYQLIFKFDFSFQLQDKEPVSAMVSIEQKREEFQNEYKKLAESELKRRQNLNVELHDRMISNEEGNRATFSAYQTTFNYYLRWIEKVKMSIRSEKDKKYETAYYRCLENCFNNCFRRLYQDKDVACFAKQRPCLLDCHDNRDYPWYLGFYELFKKHFEGDATFMTNWMTFKGSILLVNHALESFVKSIEKWYKDHCEITASNTVHINNVRASNGLAVTMMSNEISATGIYTGGSSLSLSPSVQIDNLQLSAFQVNGEDLASQKYTFAKEVFEKTVKGTNLPTYKSLDELSVEINVKGLEKEDELEILLADEKELEYLLKEFSGKYPGVIRRIHEKHSLAAPKTSGGAKRSRCDELSINLSQLSNATSRIYRRRRLGFSKHRALINSENYISDLLKDTSRYLKETPASNIDEETALTLVAVMKKDLISLVNDKEPSSKVTSSRIIESISRLKSLARNC